MSVSWWCTILFELQVMEKAQPAEGQRMLLASGLEAEGRCSSQPNMLSKALCCTGLQTAQCQIRCIRLGVTVAQQHTAAQPTPTSQRLSKWVSPTTSWR